MQNLNIIFLHILAFQNIDFFLFEKRKCFLYELRDWSLIKKLFCLTHHFKLISVRWRERRIPIKLNKNKTRTLIIHRSVVEIWRKKLTVRDGQTDIQTFRQTNGVYRGATLLKTLAIKVRIDIHSSSIVHIVQM